MDYMEEWNFLVDEHRRNRSESEDKIQSLWESYLSHPFQFGYKSGDVRSKSSLQFGSTEREVPDIILQKDGEPNCVIELKRYTLPREQKFETQLLSYMTHTDVHVSVGALVCGTLCVYWHDHAENKSECLEIPFERDSEDGAKFVELFCKQNFDAEKIREFVQTKGRSRQNVEAMQNEISADLIKQLLRDYFSDKYSADDFDKAFADMDIAIGTTASGAVFVPPAKAATPAAPIAHGKTTVTINGVTLPIYRSSAQSVQDFVKQTLTTLFGNNLLSAEEIKRLQKEDYCKQAFELTFPLLEHDFSKTTVSGHQRYWTTFQAGGFYVCNDWWKPKFPIYESKIAEWLVGLERDFQRRQART